MSIVTLSPGEPTCSPEDLQAISRASGFKVGGENEKSFLLFQNSFDATCQATKGLPDYEDPRTRPCAVEGGDRTFYVPYPSENPLGAWARKTSLISAGTSAKSGPLSGRTIAVKDNVSVAGVPLGLGTSAALLKDGVHPTPNIDATVVSRVLAAGGELKGTAACENMSMFALSYTSDAGVVHNAWLPGYATGGSSNGCGALVSVGGVKQARKDGRDARSYLLGEGVDMAIGGDQGGSIRLPAAYSGIYGLKPTHGLVPYTGIASLNPMIDHAGPMTQTVEDNALLLSILAGYDGMDFRMTPESPSRSQVPDYLGELEQWVDNKRSHDEWDATSAAKGLRVGILAESFEAVGVDQSIASTVRTTAERFKSLGADVKEVGIPMHKLGPAIWTVAARPQMPHFMSSKVPDLLGHTMPYLDPLPVDQAFYDNLANRNLATVNVLLNAAHMEHKYGPSLPRKAYMHVYELRAAYDKVFEDLDVLLTPVNPTVAPPHPSSALKTPENPDGRSENVMDLFEPAIGNTLNTCMFNCTGHPAMSIPVGWSKVKGGEGRLPVGMQVVAKRWDESSIFKACKAWEVGGKWTNS